MNTIRVIALLALLLPMSACAKANPQLSPQGQQAVFDTQVIRGLDVLRDAAIAANAQQPPVLSTASTRKVVTFHESVVKIIQAAPTGWKAAVQTAITQLQADLPASDWQLILPYVTLVQTLMKQGGAA